MMRTTHFQEELESRAGVKLQLRINDNYSTMLSVRWEPDHTKVSLHRMFLQAPRNVMDSLACYLQGKDKKMAPTIRCFIEKNVKTLDYSQEMDKNRLSTRGKVYDLQEIYSKINQEYFGGRLNVNITWFGRAQRRKRSHVNLGLYFDSRKLIKIHRMMDTEAFPKYVVSYIIYHEILHNVCPGYHENGMHKVHTKEFKELELQFREYQLAQNWLKEHHVNIFKGLI